MRSRIEALGAIGATERGGVSRQAFTASDGQGCDLVCQWMREAGLDAHIDRIGNIFGLRGGRTGDTAPVMTGSHIDTVSDGGKFDGNLGVLAGLEVVETLNDASETTEKPLCVAVFSNEEGVRFQPDMMGSLVFAGGLDADTALATVDRDGVSIAQALESIGYAGDLGIGTINPSAFVELHIEQGPVLEKNRI